MIKSLLFNTNIDSKIKIIKHIIKIIYFSFLFISSPTKKLLKAVNLFKYLMAEQEGFEPSRQLPDLHP